MIERVSAYIAATFKLNGGTPNMAVTKERHIAPQDGTVCSAPEVVFRCAMVTFLMTLVSLIKSMQATLWT